MAVLVLHLSAPAAARGEPQAAALALGLLCRLLAEASYLFLGGALAVVAAGWLHRRRHRSV